MLLIANFYTPFRVAHVSIELKPELIFNIGGLAVTNTLLSSWLSTLVLIVLAVLSSRKLIDTPAALSLQNIVETIIETLYNFMEGFAGPQARAFFPVTCTLFLFILTSNWLGLLPGFGSIGLWKQSSGQHSFVPLLKASTADLNTTVALAICSGLAGQAYGIRFLGFLEHAGRYVGIQKFVVFFRALAKGQRPRPSLLLAGALDVFIGILELFEEMTKILSFSFRLFGNIFGGEVLLAVMAFLMPYVASIPFLALEIFTGFIQALIFAILSAAFFSRATSYHDQGVVEEKERLSTPVNQQVTI